MQNKVKKYGLLIVKLLISSTVFVIVFHGVFKKETLDFLSFISYQLVLIIIITGVCASIINSFIQKNLLAVYQFKFPFKNILMHNFISTMYLLAIPGFFAPDFYLGYYYGKQKNDYGHIISALFINRAVGFTTFILLAGIALSIMGSSFIENLHIELGQLNTKLLLLIIGVCFVLLFLLWFFLKEKSFKTINEIIQIWNETRNNKKKLWYAFFLKLGFNFTGLAGRLGIGYLLGIKIPVCEFVCIILILNFLISLPVSLNGIGVREAGYVGLLSIMGVPESTAFLFALSEFGITLSAALIGILIFTSMKTKELLIKLRK